MTHVCCDTTTRQAAERDLSPLYGEIASADEIQCATCAAMGDFAEVLRADAVLARLRV